MANDSWVSCRISSATFTGGSRVEVAHLALYLCVGYGVSLVLCMLLLRESNDCYRERRGRVRRWALISSFALLPLTPYVWVGVLTAYARGGLNGVVHSSMISVGDPGPILEEHVISITRGKAVVYVVTPCGTSGSRRRMATLFTFIRRDGRWAFDGDWETVWSQCGSANGNVFPPFPDW